MRKFLHSSQPIFFEVQKVTHIVALEASYNISIELEKMQEFHEKLLMKMMVENIEMSTIYHAGISQSVNFEEFTIKKQ